MIYDVVICLGDVFTNEKNVEAMKLRTEKAVEIIKQKKANKIIFTGGFKTRKDLSEANFMANIAKNLGISAEKIILEEKAYTTIDNAVYAKKILETEKLRSAIIVTSPYHLKRAKYIFKKVMPQQKLAFVKCRDNLDLAERIEHFLKEEKTLLMLKIKRVDLSKI